MTDTREKAEPKCKADVFYSKHRKLQLLDDPSKAPILVIEEDLSVTWPPAGNNRERSIKGARFILDQLTAEQPTRYAKCGACGVLFTVSYENEEDLREMSMKCPCCGEYRDEDSQ